MPTAVIVDAIRTPGGKRGGKLSTWHPVDLASEALKAIAERNNLDPALIDDVIMGCVSQVGGQAFNVGRSAVLAAGWPESVPSTTIDRQCGSSQQALHFAAQGVMSGAYDIVVAAGIELMSTVAMGSSIGKDSGFPFGPRVRDRYEPQGGLQGQGIGAEMIADKWGISREDLDTFSAESHKRAARATAEGRFENEIIPIQLKDAEGNYTGEVMTADEGIRPDSSTESLAKLKPAFSKEGTVTAGNASGINDGAAAIVLMSAAEAAKRGLTPLARIASWATAGVDPSVMGSGPIPASRKALEKAGWKVQDLDLVEANEAFAAQALAVNKDMGWDPSIVNVNGGAIAIGHPIGASGARVFTTLLYEMQRRDAKKGLATLCIGGGMGIALCVER